MNRRFKSAFTLVEILIAMAISGLVMIGVCVLMFNTSLAIRHFEEAEPFDLHVNGVENFLRYSFRNSAQITQDDLKKAGVSEMKGTGKIITALPPDSFAGDKVKLCFGVADDRPLFIARRGISPEKAAFLDFRGEDGLYIIWFFLKNENPNSLSENPVYETLISPFVKSLEYVYIDSDDKWYFQADMDTSPASGIEAKSLPSMIKLEFERANEKFTRYISLVSNTDSQFEPQLTQVSTSSASGTSNGQSGQSGNQGGQSGSGQGGSNGGGKKGAN